MRLATYLDAAVIILTASLTASAMPRPTRYEEGDRVVVTEPAQLQVGNKAVATVGRGEFFTVQAVQGDWLWGRIRGTFGWIESKYVKPSPVAMGVTIEPRTVDTFDRGRKWAVVVAINNYLDPQIPSLRYCVSDGHLIVQTLTEHCGYEASRILTLTDDQEEDHLKPLGINLRFQIRDWLKKPRDGDTVLVFFSGHGFQDDRGQSFLAPKDCEKSNLGLTGFRVDELRDILHQCKASQKVLVLDSCHSGGEKGLETTGVSSQELGLAFRRASGMITLASCGKQEKSWEWEEKGHGLFTHFLAQGLRGAADYDRNRLVDSYELHRYVLDQVSLTAQKKLNVQQTPKLLMGEDVQGVFALARTSGRVVELRPLPPIVEDPPPVNAGTASALTAVVDVNTDFGNIHISESEGAKTVANVTVSGDYSMKSLFIQPGQRVVVNVRGDFNNIRFPESMQGKVEVRMEAGFNAVRFPDSMQGDIEVMMGDPGKLGGCYNRVYCPRVTQGSIKITAGDGSCAVYAVQAIQEKLEVLGECPVKTVYVPPETPPGNSGSLSPLTIIVDARHGRIRISESVTAKKTGTVTVDGEHVERDFYAQPGQKVVVRIRASHSDIRFPESMQGDIEVRMEGEGTSVHLPESMQGNIEVRMEGRHEKVYCPRETRGTLIFIGAGDDNTVYATQAIQGEMEVFGECSVREMKE